MTGAIGEHWTAMRLITAVALLGLGGLVIAGSVEPDSAGVALAIVLVSLGVLAIGRRDVREALRNVQKVSIGPLAVERAVADAAAAAGDTRQALGKTEKDFATDGGSNGKSILELRFQLEGMLTYIAKHLIAEDGQTSYVTIGSLLQDDLITPSQARTAARLLTFQEGAEAALPEGFREDAGFMISHFLDTVFRALVRRKLTRSRDEGGLGMQVSPAPAGAHGHPDLLVNRGSAWWLVVPLIWPGTVRGGIERLSQELKLPNVEKRLIVVPNTGVIPDVREDELAQAGADPQVVRWGKFAQAMKEPDDD